MRDDYIDFTTKQVRTPDLLACYNLFGADDEVGPFGCGDAEITFRNSLLPVPDSEYEPLSYPDREVITDTDGTPVRMAYRARTTVIACTPAALQTAGLTGDDCTEAALDQFAKFGFFRTALPTYNRQVGSTQEGRQYYANRWNIWTGDAARRTARCRRGRARATRPHPDRGSRKTRTITYYLNPEFPADQKLRDMARETVGDWNQAMKETVAGLLATGAGHFAELDSRLSDGAKSLPNIFVSRRTTATSPTSRTS